MSSRCIYVYTYYLYIQVHTYIHTYRYINKPAIYIICIHGQVFLSECMHVLIFKAVYISLSLSRSRSLSRSLARSYTVPAAVAVCGPAAVAGTLLHPSYRQQPQQISICRCTKFAKQVLWDMTHAISRLLTQLPSHANARLCCALLRVCFVCVAVFCVASQFRSSHQQLKASYISSLRPHTLVAEGLIHQQLKASYTSS